MEVTGLVISEKVGLATVRKSGIRAEVRRLEEQLNGESPGMDFKKDLNRTSSKIGQMGRVNPGKAGRLKARVASLRKASRSSGG